MCGVDVVVRVRSDPETSRVLARDWGEAVNAPVEVLWEPVGHGVQLTHGRGVGERSVREESIGRRGTGDKMTAERGGARRSGVEKVRAERVRAGDRCADVGWPDVERPTVGRWNGGTRDTA